MSDTNRQMLKNEDLRWLELIQDMINGLRAQAEIEADACETEWMAMQYSLEQVDKTIKVLIEEYKERLG